MTLEEKILAYLDGSLDEESSAELLHSLSTSPEKRALLDEHLRLRNILALGQKPFAIPATTESTLASRIPALAGREDIAARLVRRSALSTLFAGVGEWFGGFVQAPVARWSFGVASLAAIGLTAWLLNTAPSATPENPVMPGSPLTSTTELQSGRSAGASTHGAMKTGAASERSPHKPNVAYVAATDPIDAATETSGNESSRSLPQSDDDSSPVGRVESLPARALSVPPSIPATAASQPLLPHASAPLAASSLPGLTVTLGYAQYQYQLPGVGSAVTANGSHPEIGASYELSEHVALRAEGGIASHPTFETTAKIIRVTSIGGQSYSRVVYGTNVTTSDAAFSRLGFEYIINPGASYELRLSGTGGVQFATSLMPTASVIVGVSHPLNSLLAIDLAAIYTGTWGQSFLTPNTTAVDSLNGAVGLVHSEAPIPSTVFAPAFGLRAGLRYQF